MLRMWVPIRRTQSRFLARPSQRKLDAVVDGTEGPFAIGRDAVCSTVTPGLDADQELHARHAHGVVGSPFERDVSAASIEGRHAVRTLRLHDVLFFDVDGVGDSPSHVSPELGRRTTRRCARD